MWKMYSGGCIVVGSVVCYSEEISIERIGAVGEKKKHTICTYIAQAIPNNLLA